MFSPNLVGSHWHSRASPRRNYVVVDASGGCVFARRADTREPSAVVEFKWRPPGLLYGPFRRPGGLSEAEALSPADAAARRAAAADPAKQRRLQRRNLELRAFLPACAPAAPFCQLVLYAVSCKNACERARELVRGPEPFEWHAVPRLVVFEQLASQ